MRRLLPPGPPRAVLRVLSFVGHLIRISLRPGPHDPNCSASATIPSEPANPLQFHGRTRIQELTMKEPERIKPIKLADYLEVLSKAVFEGGMNWEVIESKWPGFQEAFDGFDPEKIASYSPEDIDRLMADPRIIRNGRKVNATIH